MRSMHSKAIGGLPPLALSGAGDWGAARATKRVQGTTRSISPKKYALASGVAGGVKPLPLLSGKLKATTRLNIVFL